MIFGNPYWSVQTKLDLLARWLIVHSIMYYEVGTSIVTDQMFDNNARQYVELASQYPSKQAQTRWLYVMKDFDATTGFHLFSRLKRDDKKRLLHIATKLVEQYGDASLVLDPRKRKRR